MVGLFTKKEATKEIQGLIKTILSVHQKVFLHETSCSQKEGSIKVIEIRKNDTC